MSASIQQHHLSTTGYGCHFNFLLLPLNCLRIFTQNVRDLFLRDGIFPHKLPQK
eukprot:UN08122